MSDAPNPDRSSIENVHRDVQGLRSKARASGSVGSKNGDLTSDSQAPAVSNRGPGEEDGDKGKQAAAKLLALFRRGADDSSPIVPGTDFTEKGVARVLKLLTTPREREGGSQKMLQRLHNFLTGPAAQGSEIVSGISVQKLRRVSRILKQIEKHGWEHVQTQIAQRKSAGTAAKPRAIAESDRVEAPAPVKSRSRRRPRS